MLVQIPSGAVNRTRGEEVEVWTLAGFTSYFNWLDCAATPYPGWAFFAPFVHPWTEARRKLKCGVFVSWVGHVGREQFLVWTFATFSHPSPVVISGVATELGFECLTVVALVGEPGASAFGKLLIGIDKTRIGDHPLCFRQVLRLVDNILFTVVGVWWKFAFGKQYFIWTPGAPWV